MLYKRKYRFFWINFYPKRPRNIKLKNAITLINFSKKKKIQSVGVFVNEPIKLLIEKLQILNLDYVQLHGNENNDYIQNLKKEFDTKVIKSVSIRKKIDLKKTNQYSNADMLLFDYKPSKEELPGGNAKSFDWNLIKGINIQKKWFISGGINIKNIKEIKNFAIPYGIDISSGVEDKIGIKNDKKIKSLIKIYNEK